MNDIAEYIVAQHNYRHVNEVVGDKDCCQRALAILTQLQDAVVAR